MVLPVCAEEVEEVTQTTEAVEPATEVGDGTDQDIDGVDAETAPTEEVLKEYEMESPVVYGEGNTEEKPVTDVELQVDEMEEVKTYGEEEEEGGFWAWLVSLWEAILDFFGL